MLPTSASFSKKTSFVHGPSCPQIQMIVRVSIEFVAMDRWTYVFELATFREVFEVNNSSGC